MTLVVLSPGVQTTVQDLGRTGYRHLGVGQSGAADAVSLRMANLLVGNPEDAAGLEITLGGPRLRFLQDATIALCGAEIAARLAPLATEEAPLPLGKPLRIPAGAELLFGACRGGARAYLAVRGGIATPSVLGSRSADLSAGFSGLAGRALSIGDRLEVGAPPASPEPVLTRCSAGPQETAPTSLRVLPGAHLSLLSDEARAALQRDGAFAVAPDASRMGLRLRGPRLLPSAAPELLSEPATPGTVQLPPDGNPIVLGVEAPTTGGYPRIAHVIAADLPRQGQLRPGDPLCFRFVTEEEALDAWRLEEQRLGMLAVGLFYTRGPK